MKELETNWNTWSEQLGNFRFCCYLIQGSWLINLFEAYKKVILITDHGQHKHSSLNIHQYC